MNPVPDSHAPENASRTAGALRAMWAAPVVFLVHDLEEILAIGPWMAAHGAELPSAMQPLAMVTRGQLATAVAILFAGMLAATAHGAGRARAGRRPDLFLLAAGMLIANGMTHLAQAALLRGYTPGVITALLVVAPYGYLLARRLTGSGIITTRAAVAFLALGAIAQVPLVVLMLLLVS
jgi:hypothetical protein